ncbi:MAG: hypothetical protein QM500_13935 [Methylococcales bacterium]
MAFNPLANFNQGFKSSQEQQANSLASFNKLEDSRQKAFFQDARVGRQLLESGDYQGFLDLANNRLNLLEQTPNADASDVQSVLQSFNSGDIQGTIQQLKLAEEAGITTTDSKGNAFLSDPLDRQLKQANINKVSKGTAEQREFADLTKGLTKEQKKEATLIKLGLSPRAVGNAIQTIDKLDIAEQIGKAKATIKQREKFGELTASRRSKVIDSGFNKIEKINAGILNIDRAISVLNTGAGVGAIQKFLPSFKASSVELDNIQKSMALDVIGSVTFGALSQGELDLAKEVALPTGLDTPQLIDYLTRRKTAQEKLKSYYREQIDFLDQGGTVAGFLRSKDRETEQDGTNTQQTPQGQSLNFDAQGNLIQ